MNELEKKERYSVLLDLYGDLLGTEERKRAQAHYYSDFSLAEIAEEEGKSRNAIHISIKAAERKLDEYENRLGLMRRNQQIREILDQLEEKNTDEKTAKLYEHIRRLLLNGI